MSMQLEVDYVNAREFARHLDSVQTNLEAAAPTMPSRVLAGDGTAYILAQISRYSEPAELFASLAEQASGLVSKGIDQFVGVDQEIADALSILAEEMKQ